MSEIPNHGKETGNIDPRFHKLHANMLSFVRNNGVAIEARALTPEEQASPGAQVTPNMPPLTYLSLSRALDPTSSTDSRLAWGHWAPEDAYGGKRLVYVVALGEGPTIRYDQFGSIGLLDESANEQQEFVLGTDGIATVYTGHDCGTASMRWEMPRPASPDELDQLNEAFDHIQPGGLYEGKQS